MSSFVVVSSRLPILQQQQQQQVIQATLCWKHVAANNYYCRKTFSGRTSRFWIPQYVVESIGGIREPSDDGGLQHRLLLRGIACRRYSTPAAGATPMLSGARSFLPGANAKLMKFAPNRAAVQSSSLSSGTLPPKTTGDGSSKWWR